MVNLHGMFLWYITMVQDMGFTAAEAREALQFTNGDVEAAASYLAA